VIASTTRHFDAVSGSHPHHLLWVESGRSDFRRNRQRANVRYGWKADIRRWKRDAPNTNESGGTLAAVIDCSA
jgi:hypothetical protein